MNASERAAALDPGANLASRRLAVRDVHMGPVTHIADERARLAALSFEHFDVRRLAPTIGAELHGIDLTTTLPDAAIQEIRRALHEFKVVFFRDQPLTPDQHVAFARRFGALEIHPFIPPNPDVPELVRFEKTAEVAGYENAWHHDVTWRECPSMGAILHAITVPDIGGDTLFCDMYAAYGGLDDALRARVDELDAVHDYVQAFGAQVPADQRASMRERFPQVVHPVVPRHAATGRRHLYVNRIFVDRLVTDDVAESRELLERLCRQADYPEYQCRFRWEPHSVAFWDNRAVQHYASSDYWPEVRVMERASIVGGRPSR
jgi:alpha-ketoglutarate-dependent sulfate ester dioxygenase